MALPKTPIDPNGYPELQPGTFVRYNGPSCGVKPGDIALITKRSAPGLMRNSFARVAIITQRAENVVHVPAYDVQKLDVVQYDENGWPKTIRRKRVDGVVEYDVDQA